MFKEGGCLLGSGQRSRTFILVLPGVLGFLHDRVVASASRVVRATNKEPDFFPVAFRFEHQSIIPKRFHVHASESYHQALAKLKI